MKIPILIEPVAGNGFRSRGGEQFSLVAEGPTRDAVLTELQEQLRARMCNGAELVSLEVSPQPHPLTAFAGMFKDDPWLNEWKQSMQEYRTRIDDEPDEP